MREDASKLEEENKRISAALLELENARKSHQDLLDNISNFGASVYR